MSLLLVDVHCALHQRFLGTHRMTRRIWVVEERMLEILGPAERAAVENGIATLLDEWVLRGLQNDNRKREGAPHE